MAASSNPVRLDQADLQSIIERALEEARARGASQAEAAVSQDTGLSVGVRLGEVETLEHQRDRSKPIRCLLYLLGHGSEKKPIAGAIKTVCLEKQQNARQLTDAALGRGWLGGP